MNVAQRIGENDFVRVLDLYSNNKQDVCILLIILIITFSNIYY